MKQIELLSINNVAAKMGLSVHQLRRWELMFALDIKRGRGQQRQYRVEDINVLERIRELVEQGWPTIQIRPQLEAEGLVTPRLIGMPSQITDNPEVLAESIIGLRHFTERRLAEITKQIDDLRQLMISLVLKEEPVSTNEPQVYWEPAENEILPPPPPALPAQEISIGPALSMLPDPLPIVSIHNNMDQESLSLPSASDQPGFDSETPASPENHVVSAKSISLFDNENEYNSEHQESTILEQPLGSTLSKPQNVTPIYALNAKPLGEVTDQNYLTVLGRALDLVNWSDEQADVYSKNAFGIAHWDELGRSQAEKLIDHLIDEMRVNWTQGTAVGV